MKKTENATARTIATTGTVFSAPTSRIRFA
jgi:hypothetical protein